MIKLWVSLGLFISLALLTNCNKDEETTTAASATTTTTTETTTGTTTVGQLNLSLDCGGKACIGTGE